MKDKPGIPLYLFAKAPLPGQVKTRMSPGLTPQQCADLAVMMLEQSMAKVANSWPGRKVLAVTPDPDHPVFRKLVSVHGFETRIQAAGDLGHRMWDMLTSGIKSAGAAVVMGCDVPQIPEGLLFRAHEDVLSGLNVIGPARDGGFYLLGIGKDSPAPFDQINQGAFQASPDYHTAGDFCAALAETRCDFDYFTDVETQAPVLARRRAGPVIANVRR